MFFGSIFCTFGAARFFFLMLVKTLREPEKWTRPGNGRVVDNWGNNWTGTSEFTQKFFFGKIHLSLWSNRFWVEILRKKARNQIFIAFSGIQQKFIVSKCFLFTYAVYPNYFPMNLNFQVCLGSFSCCCRIAFIFDPTNDHLQKQRNVKWRNKEESSRRWQKLFKLSVVDWLVFLLIYFASFTWANVQT